MSEQQTTTTANQTASGREHNNSMSFEDKKKAQLEAAAALRAANPHLVPGGDCVTAAKNIRIELKRAFPSIKFTVKTSKFSMGNSVRIGWVDGPTTAQVDAITDKYAAGSFDGMEDLYRYESTAHHEAFGSAKYVSTSRDFSPAFITALIAEIGAKWHDGPLPTAEEYKQGHLFHVHPDRHNGATWQELIYRTGYQTAASI